MSRQQAIKIVAIGDSITYGFPYTPAQSWLNQAAELLQIPYVNSGENGDTTDGMLIRFRRDVIRHQPTHVVIMGGTNDAYYGAEPGRVLANIREMVELAWQHGIIPVVGLPIPCNDVYESMLLSSYRDGMRSYAAANNLTVIDFCTPMTADGGKTIKDGYHVDGVHPNRVGYKVMTETAVKVFKTFLPDAAEEQ